MAYTPTLADIDKLDKESGFVAGGYQPTQADIDALGDVPRETPSYLQGLEQAGKGILGIPGALYKGAVGTGKEFYQHPLQATQDLGEGIAGYAINKLAPMLQKGARSGLDSGALEGAGIEPSLFKQDPYDLPKFSITHPQAAAEHTGEFLASMLPMVKGGQLIEKLVQGVSEGLPQFAGKRIATALAGGSGAGAAVSPMVGMDPRVGATLGALTPGGVKPVARGVRGFVGGTATPEEFAAARASVPAGIKAPIGELAQSPRAQQAYNLAQSMFGSGAGKPYEQLQKYIVGKQEGIMEPPVKPIQDVNQHVYNEMKGNYETAKQNTGKAYARLATAADEGTLTIPEKEKGLVSELSLKEGLEGALREKEPYKTEDGVPVYRGIAPRKVPAKAPVTPRIPFNRDALDEVLNTQIEETKKKMTSTAGKARYRPILQHLTDYKKDEFKTFSPAYTEIATLNDLVGDAVAKDDKPLVRNLMAVKKGFEKSIDESAQDHPELKNYWQAAKNARIHQGKFEKLNMKQESPFFQLYNKYRGTESPADAGSFDLIGKYIKPSTKTSEKSGLLKHLTDRISPETTKTMANEYLESDNLTDFLKKLKGLSKKQHTLLLGEKGATDAQQILDISKIFPKAATGGMKGSGAHGIARAVEAAGAGITALHSTLQGDPLAAAATVAAIPTLGQTIQRILRSEMLKKAYARSLEKGAKPRVAPSLREMLRAGTIQQGAQ